MIYFFISDIHNNYKNLVKVITEIKASTTESFKLICLGDIFEVKVSKKKIDSFFFDTIDEVINDGSQLVKKLKATDLIRGNQEERLYTLVPPNKLPSYLKKVYSQLKEQIQMDDKFKAIHGHQYTWSRYDDFSHHPLIEFDEHPILFYGHSHENNLFRAILSKENISYHKNDIEFDKPYRLVQNLNVKYLINVGSLKDSEINWVKYDSENRLVTFYNKKV
ncbi:metallophosphatase family protein [Salipaludibacillus sp. LMS25]|jgi:predicted phosphodiesterase|uniref:metallophosphoesterase family protein n=1 Tax=Salipaludibacillus sp. LMS25 TaxID=2924031 RepID=UPI0020D1602F|nr:metallophosphoesterase family protein [Salipaludibacillus sp. LMS25]UTR15948.1 metallophosphatase family protein [Salipaludibacillus sp. LMS25]